MSLVLKNVEVVCASSKHHGDVVDLIIERGVIQKIGVGLSSKKEFNGEGLKISKGWFDLRAQSCDPGLEHRETLETLMRSALKGGVTGVAVLPNTHPSIDTKDVLEYVQSKTKGNVVDVLQYASVTKGNKGSELVDMLDLHQSGAIGFSDGENTIHHTGILMKSLQYLQKVNGLIVSKVFDHYLIKQGLVNEGINSTLNGLKGIPALAETLAIQKVIDVMSYTGGRFHFSCISTKESVELIKEAKKSGLSVSCDVAAHQLAFDDAVIGAFDTNYKVNPPFRTKEDIKALVKGLKEGVIDCCVSDHTPLDTESKELEFDMADFGIIGIQTLFPVLNTYSKLALDEIVMSITDKPRMILGLPQFDIAEGEKANLTVFDSNVEWELSTKDITSRSKNSPFIGEKLKGKAIAVVNKGEFIKL